MLFRSGSAAKAPERRIGGQSLRKQSNVACIVSGKNKRTMLRSSCTEGLGSGSESLAAAIPRGRRMAGSRCHSTAADSRAREGGPELKERSSARSTTCGGIRHHPGRGDAEGILRIARWRAEWSFPESPRRDGGRGPAGTDRFHPRGCVQVRGGTDARDTEMHSRNLSCPAHCD